MMRADLGAARSRRRDRGLQALRISSVHQGQGWLTSESDSAVTGHNAGFPR